MHFIEKYLLKWPVWALKGEIDGNKIIVGVFNTPFTSMDRSPRQKTNKECTWNITAQISLPSWAMGASVPSFRQLFPPLLCFFPSPDTSLLFSLTSSTLVLSFLDTGQLQHQSSQLVRPRSHWLARAHLNRSQAEAGEAHLLPRTSSSSRLTLREDLWAWSRFRPHLVWWLEVLTSQYFHLYSPALFLFFSLFCPSSLHPEHFLFSSCWNWYLFLM